MFRPFGCALLVLGRKTTGGPFAVSDPDCILVVIAASLQLRENRKVF